MPGKHTRAAMGELKAAKWKVSLTNARAHAYAVAFCPGGRGCCPPFSINGTPDVDEHEAEKIQKRMRRHDAKMAAQEEGDGE